MRYNISHTESYYKVSHTASYYKAVRVDVAEQGYLVDVYGNYIYDKNGNRIPVKTQI